jgi:hypothetical protein
MVRKHFVKTIQLSQFPIGTGQWRAARERIAGSVTRSRGVGEERSLGSLNSRRNR